MNSISTSELREDESILIVDDNEENRRLLNQVLIQAGYKVRIADSASLVLRTIHTQSPSLILMDIHMPDMDGFELCRRIKADPATRGIPVIFISASSGSSKKPDGFAAGAVDFITKPFSQSEVLARVATHLKLYRTSRDLEKKNTQLQAEMVERLSSDEKLKASENLFSTIFRDAPLGISLVDSLTGHTYASNSMFNKIIGRDNKEMAATDWMSITHHDDVQKDLDNMALMMAGKIPGFTMQKRYLQPDGLYKWVNMTIAPISTPDSDHPQHICMLEDISESKLLEKYLEMERDILQALAGQESVEVALQKIVSILRAGMEFDAVGVRLKKADDFPYLAEEGFPQDFLSTENSLIHYAADGTPCRDTSGQIRLECACGLVVTGTKGLENPLVTPGGSFWTNNSSSILSLLPCQDPRYNPRNKCIHGEYESIALMPIRDKDKIVGLLHLNDHRKNRLTLKTVELLEDIALHIGEAIIRMQTNEALQVSELRYKTFIDASSDIIFLKDDASKYFISNTANNAFLGTSEENVIGHSDLDLLPKDIAEKWRAGDQDVIGKKSKLLYNATVGQKIYETIKFPVTLPGGNTGIGSIIRDITVQKEADETINKERTFFNQLIETAPLGIAIIDPQRNVKRVNREFVRMFGFSPEEVMGRDIDGLIIPADRHEESERLIASIRSGENRTLESLRRKKDGSLLAVSITGAPISIEGRDEGIFALYRDITQRKKAEEKLQSSEEQYRTLFESMPIGVYYCSPKGRIVSANAAAEDIFGMPLDEIQSRTPADPCWKYLREDGSNFPLDTLPSILALSTGKAVHDVLIGIFNQREQGYRWVRSSAMPQYKPGEQAPYQVYVTLEDITKLREAELAIEESEEKFRSVFELSPIGKSLTELGGAVHVNQAFAEMLGYTVRELESIHWKQLTFKDDIQKSVDLIEDLMSRKKQSVNIEKRYIHKNGSTVWTSVHTALLRKTDGTPRFFVTSIENITQRKKNEELQLKTELALKNMLTISNRFLEMGSVGVDYSKFTQMILDISGAAFSTFNVFDSKDLSFTSVAVSGLPDSIIKASSLLGFPLTGKKWKNDPVRAAKIKDSNITRFSSLREITGTTIPGAIAKMIEESFNLGEALIVKISQNKKEIGDFSLFFSKGDTLQNKELVELFASEVGLLIDRLRTEEELRDSNELFSLFMHYSPIYAYIKSITANESRVLRVSDNYSQMIGIPANDIIGKTMTELFAPELAATMTADDISVVTKGKILRIDEELNGHSYTSIKFPISQEGRTLLAGYTIDITEQKRAEAELNTLNSQLEERVLQRTNELTAANKELEAFSYSVSHDLRTPLRSIEGFTDIFLREFGSSIPENGHSYLERVRRNAVHMGRLIDDLLKLSRVTSSKLVLETTDLSAQANHICKELTIDNPGRNVLFGIEPGITALADSHLMQIVLTNLLGNAWKFTSRKQDAQIDVGVSSTARGTVFFVRDNGAGFDNAYNERLFSAFQRLHSDKEFAGTGIGLATVARVIKRHGGDVWAEGEVDKGATFYFTLPGLKKSV